MVCQLPFFLLSLLAGLVSHSLVDATVSDKNRNLSSLLHRTSKVRGANRRDLGTGSRDIPKGMSSKSKVNVKAITRFHPHTLEDINSNRDDYHPHGKVIEVNVESETRGIPAVTKGSRNADITRGKSNSDQAPTRHQSHEHVVENGAEHFQKVDVEIYRRQIPKFSIHFTVEKTDNPPNMADYNELSEVSEAYLDDFFRSVFEDLEVRHDGTVLFVSVNEENPFTVDLVVTLEFIIPGSVPTINFLIDRLQDGLERETSMAFFVSDLSTMSRTNPFSNTVSIEVISRPAITEAEILGEDDDNPSSGSNSNKNMHILASFFAGMGCVILVVAGLAFVRKMKRNKDDVSKSGQTFALFDKSKDSKSNPDAIESGSSGIYGADEETTSYLNSIRKRYKDIDGKIRSGRNRKEQSVFRKKNISAVEVAGSFYEQDDSGTVSTASQNEEQEKTEKTNVNYLNLELNTSDVEDDLQSIH